MKDIYKTTKIHSIRFWNTKQVHSQLSLIFKGSVMQATTLIPFNITYLHIYSQLHASEKIWPKQIRNSFLILPLIEAVAIKHVSREFQKKSYWKGCLSQKQQTNKKRHTTLWRWFCFISIQTQLDTQHSRNQRKKILKYPII